MRNQVNVRLAGRQQARLEAYADKIGLTPPEVARVAIAEYLDNHEKGSVEMLYTTWGSVRGCCGHAHKTAEAAEECINQDAHGCMLAGGYSDREVRAIESRKDLEDYDVTKGPGKSVVE